MGLRCDYVLLDGSGFGAPFFGHQSCHPITDCKEPEGQGQRRGRGFLWIREAGIPVLGKSLEFDPKWGFSKKIRMGFDRVLQGSVSFFARKK